MSIEDDLIRDEGVNLSAYQDSRGFWTIGIGHLIDARKGGGISEEVARSLLTVDIDKAESELRKTFTWFLSAPSGIQRGLTNMCFQMGLGELLGFQNMLKAMSVGDYEKAADEALLSDWAAQTPSRANRVAELFRGAANV